MSRLAYLRLKARVRYFCVLALAWLVGLAIMVFFALLVTWPLWFDFVRRG